MEPVQEVRVLTALAGIPASSDREAALAVGLEGMRRIAQALAWRDYGDAEPACQFRVPPSSAK